MLSMLMNRKWLKSKGKPNSSSSKGRILFRIMNYHFNTPYLIINRLPFQLIQQCFFLKES